MKDRLLLTDASGLRPFARSLAALEREITYPIADGRDRFFIDHGERYSDFFTTLGDARFLLALSGDEVVGCVVGVFREARLGDRVLRAAYLCDLKVSARRRGTGLARRMATFAIGRAIVDPRLWRWRLAYGAAMRGESGDVMRSVRGLHAGRLLGHDATLAVYFVPAEKLADSRVSGCPPNPGGIGLELSARDQPAALTTAGKKDLRLVSTGRPWPLVHLPRGPREWSPNLAAYLGEAAKTLPADALTCFALDERHADHRAWLASHDITPGASCAVYTLALTSAPHAWTHLATSEI